jgi:hypothetical protein
VRKYWHYSGVSESKNKQVFEDNPWAVGKFLNTFVIWKVIAGYVINAKSAKYFSLSNDAFSTVFAQIVLLLQLMNFGG